MPEITWIWGMPLVRWTRSRVVDEIVNRIDTCAPTYFVTVNLNYCMLVYRLCRLYEVNKWAEFLVADGAPLVLMSHWLGLPLPERVTGSDLIYDLGKSAATKGHRVFLLGGGAGVAELAARRLVALYPELIVVGTASPNAEELHGPGLDDLRVHIRATRPDILLVALGQPKGEIWIVDHHEELGALVSVQVGATLDFVAGRVRRAPQCVQKLHMEWAYRMCQDPRRLFIRYVNNLMFAIKIIVNEMLEK